MKVLIVSDIHGGYSNIKKVLDDNPKFDLLLILGDILYGGSNSDELSSLLNKYNMPDLPYDIYIQGHTHIPIMDYGDKLYLNPGSITRPRGGSVKSYIFYENGEFMLKSVDENTIIKKITID